MLYEGEKETIVIYHYYESVIAKQNLMFFLQVALNNHADYLFILSGECSVQIPSHDNLKVISIENSGSDFAAYKEVIRNFHADRYDALIFINCSVAGPFVLWTQFEMESWTEIFTKRLRDKVKLVGTTINFLPPGTGFAWYYGSIFGKTAPLPHVQSMVFALDRTAFNYLQEVRFFEDVGVDRRDIIARGEIRLSQLILEKGWWIDSVTPGYSGLDYASLRTDPNPTSIEGDCWSEGGFFGRSIHPYECVFYKRNRLVRDPEEISSLMLSIVRSRQEKPKA